MQNKTMSELGVDFSTDSSDLRHTVVTDPVSSDMLELSMNESPCLQQAPDLYFGRPDITAYKKRYLQPVWSEDGTSFKTLTKSETSYVGLVNQAMTCYLNSLLQALYMTPEFRNALYNWEYIEGSEKDETKSIPYQLQKLFLNLQTSTKSAVETTSLTKSFGWDSTEAWQQHDIQELCRVMFDALEQKFKNTDQADLINRLYEGKMIDYVKCLECGTEKSREDTFLDIPLPVRPFGSNVAYNSVEEAIRAFVQYETLEGANQYHCEKCNKKCDAHKGLKFTKFPYLLTLHLKRFDFDYKTCHRIKLNEKVTFPDVLNLNCFISSATNKESPSGDEDIGLGVKCDDSSTTDSGTLDDDCPPCDNSLSNSNHSTNHDQDDDEGIDMSNGPSTSNCNTHNHENEKIHGNYAVGKGPCQYELFSIMIHSGSASGGHYYAYIKDFRTQEWLCFNDQNVTQITHDDIQKTYGGGPSRVYYSGAYSSSTNAYMLMYRQIDHTRNALPMQVQDFPEHIKELLKKMKETEDNDRRNIEKQMSMPKLTVYCRHPTEEIIMENKLYIFPDCTWAEATEQAYKKFGLEGIVSLEQCRLVNYEHEDDLIVCSYQGVEQEQVCKIWITLGCFDLLLEIRRKDQKFETYCPGGVTTRVCVIDIPRGDVIDGPINVRGVATQTVKDYKNMLGKIINMDPKQMKLALLKYPTEIKLLEKEDSEFQDVACHMHCSTKIFVSTMFDTDSNKPFHESTFYKIIEKFENVISLHVQLPDTSKETLDELNIPSLDEKHKDEEKPVANGPSKLSVTELHRDVGQKCNVTSKSVRTDDTRNISPQLGECEEWNTPEQSNSEDSSLSDSDRTLIGDEPEEDDFAITYIPANVPADSSDNGSFGLLNQIEIEHWDIDDDSKYYFKVLARTSSTQKLLKILVDTRIRLSTLKKGLEPFVGVPMEYFKLFRQSSQFDEFECVCLTEKLGSYSNNERLNLKLGRTLRSGEFKVRLYQLQIAAIEPYKLLYDWILSKDTTVGHAKKEILAEIKRKFGIDIPYEKCRLRKKDYKNVGKVLLDDQKFEDLQLYPPYEMIVQELPDKETVTNANQLVIFVRKWSPSKMQLGPFEEVVMDGKSIEELKQKLSGISDIPEECIDIARGKDSFPCNISVLKVQTELDWCEYPNRGSHATIDDEFVYLYRNNREKVRSLTRDEMKEIATKEISRLTLLSTASSYSPRRERALKIYLDTK